MRKAKLGQKILRVFYQYMLFFLLVAFLVSCSMMLFITVMVDSLNLNLTSENISMAAKLTFGNVIFLSVLFLVIDTIRRKVTTERMTKHIAQAAQKVVQGDFNVRIAPVSAFSVDETFNEIIESFIKVGTTLTKINFSININVFSFFCKFSFFRCSDN